MRYLLFSLPRSGSRLLCSLLSSHPHIACPHELYADYRFRESFRDAMDVVSEAWGKPVVVGHAHFAQTHSNMLNDKTIKRLLLERKERAIPAVLTMLLGVQRSEGYSMDEVEKNRVARVADHRSRDYEYMRPFCHGVVTFEEMTENNQVVSVLNEKTTRYLCDFFSVPYHPLSVTVNYKETVALPKNITDLVSTIG